MRFTHVLFDHDDTLLATFELRARVLRHAVFAVSGESRDMEGYLRESHGRSLEQMARDLVGETRADALVNAYRDEYYRANKTGLAPYPGIADLLEALSALGVVLAVVTSKLGRGAREELQAAGLMSHFSTLVGSEDVSAHKPAPEPFERAMAAIAADHARTIMIGDTTADMLGARAAGIACAAALWGASEPESLRACAPDYSLLDPRELAAIVQSG